MSQPGQHRFVEKPHAQWAADHYGSELAADIGYCNICNRPFYDHEDAFGLQAAIKEAIDKTGTR